MTSTPHFALAQHPETGEWVCMDWHAGLGWIVAGSVIWFHWYPTRIAALEATRALCDGWIDIPAHVQAAITTLDRLIAHEQGQAGDEAAVQTIQALKGE